jgi:hypothetical protein
VQQEECKRTTLESRTKNTVKERGEAGRRRDNKRKKPMAAETRKATQSGRSKAEEQHTPEIVHLI